MNDLANRICHYNEIYMNKIDELEKENKIMKKQINALTSTTINGYSIIIVYCEYDCGIWDIYEDKDGFKGDDLDCCPNCLMWVCSDCRKQYWKYGVCKVCPRPRE